MKVKYDFVNSDVNKICPRCHGSFHCKVEEGCWCENIHLSQETLKKLRRDYIDCLCKNCLTAIEADKK